MTHTPHTLEDRFDDNFFHKDTCITLSEDGKNCYCGLDEVKIFCISEVQKAREEERERIHKKLNTSEFMDRFNELFPKTNYDNPAKPSKSHRAEALGLLTEFIILILKD